MGVGSKTGRRTWTRGENVVREVRGGVGVMLKIVKEVCIETGEVSDGFADMTKFKQSTLTNSACCRGSEA